MALTSQMPAPITAAKATSRIKLVSGGRAHPRFHKTVLNECYRVAFLGIEFTRLMKQTLSGDMARSEGDARHRSATAWPASL
jgi:hypothetical protein